MSIKAGIYVQTNTRMFWDESDTGYKNKRNNFKNGILLGIREIIIRNVLKLHVIICVDIYYGDKSYNKNNIRNYIYDTLSQDIHIFRCNDYNMKHNELNNRQLNNYIHKHVHILFPSEHVHATIGRNIIYNYIRRNPKYDFLWFGSDDDDFIIPTHFIQLYYTLHNMEYIDNNIIHKTVITTNTRGYKGMKYDNIPINISSITNDYLHIIHQQTLKNQYNIDINNYIILHHSIKLSSAGIFGGAPWCYLINPHRFNRTSFRCLPFNREDIELFESFIVNDKLLVASYYTNKNLASPYVYGTAHNQGVKDYFDKSIEIYQKERSNINKSGPLFTQYQNTLHFASIRYFEKLNIPVHIANIIPEWNNNSKELMMFDEYRENRYISPDDKIFGIAHNIIRKCDDGEVHLESTYNNIFAKINTKNIKQYNLIMCPEFNKYRWYKIKNTGILCYKDGEVYHMFDKTFSIINYTIEVIKYNYKHTLYTDGEFYYYVDKDVVFEYTYPITIHDEMIPDDIINWPLYRDYKPYNQNNIITSSYAENYNGDLYIVGYTDGVKYMYTLQNGYYPLDINDYDNIFNEFINTYVSSDTNITPYTHILHDCIPEKQIMKSTELYNKFIVKQLYMFILNEGLDEITYNELSRVVNDYNKYWLNDGEYGVIHRKIPPKVIGGNKHIIMIWLLIMVIVVVLVIILNAVNNYVRLTASITDL